MALRVYTEQARDAAEIWLAPNAAVGDPPIAVYCIGALRLPREPLERLAGAIYQRHRAQPDRVLLWHVGADTPEGGLLSDVFRAGDGPARIADFLRHAGDYGLWWPETWRNISRHLRARPLIADLAVILLQTTIERGPHYWDSADAKDGLGKTLFDELDRRIELGKLGRNGLRPQATGLTVVGDGQRCFTDHPGVRTLTLAQLMRELGTAPIDAAPSVDPGFDIDVFGIGDTRPEVNPDWTLRPRQDGRHRLYPNKDGITITGPCRLVRIPGVDVTRIRAELPKR
jgi:hypothetical protein